MVEAIVRSLNPTYDSSVSTHHGQVLLLREDSGVAGADGGGVGSSRRRGHVPQARLQCLNLRVSEQI